MIEIGRAIVSTEILKKEFVCDLSACRGICCIEGEAGAPLGEEELTILDDIFEDIKPYMRKEGIKAVEGQGKYVIDTDGEYVTPLVDGKECAYVNFNEQGIAKCAIEDAFEDGVTDFQKPMSCHLYPVRIDSYEKMDAVNYHKWEICNDACTCGAELEVKVYRFVKEALIRKYGEDWYKELEGIAEAADKIKK